ncbi:RNA-directed DNA polymerase, eukaryota, reverse transcriptase zinc-binding domain protein [Tanacetum coccineum]
MSNKKRSTKRKLKLPSKYNDHVMSDMSKKRYELNSNDDPDEIRVPNDVGEFGENCKEKVDDVSECVEKEMEQCTGVSESMGLKNDEEIRDCSKEKVTGVFGCAGMMNNDCNVASVGMNENIKGKEMESEDLSEKVMEIKENSSSIPDKDKAKANNVSHVDVPNCSIHKMHVVKDSYAKKVGNSANEIDNNLCFVPTYQNECGDEVVIFEEELVVEGCKRWQFTVCGYFVGSRMTQAEIRYNIRRMWSKYGLSEIHMDNNEVCFFKFKSLDGMNHVINQSPWMVKGKPMIVQEWDPSVNIEKVEPCKIPIWARMINVPLEAWSSRGISTLASRLGRPIMMDSMTASMCYSGIGRIGYARVLVEINAKKGLPEKIDIVYKDDMSNTKMTKEKSCKNKVNDVIEQGNMKDKANTMRNEKTNNEEFVEVRSRKNFNNGFNVQQRKKYKEQASSSNFFYRPKINQKSDNRNETMNMEQVNNKGKDGVQSQEKPKNMSSESPPSLEKNMEESVNHDERLAADWYVLRKKKPSVEDIKKWSYEMVQYFKYKWQVLNGECVDSETEEDIIEDRMNMNEGLIADEIEGGISNEVKQNEAIKFLSEENLHVCAFIETHLKQNSILRVGNKIFGQWEWISNIHHSPTSCRIIMGWNPFYTRIMNVSMSKQSMFCIIETIPRKIKFYCSFVYASNSGIERRILWKELEQHKYIARGYPWLILGDFNVTLDVVEHSSGVSHITNDMQEFKDTVNMLELEDICSSGFHFTWTKSLHNPNCNVLKKLDRMMINEEFM